MGVRRTWDFRCDDCGKLHGSVMFTEKVPQTIPCEACGGTASWASFKPNGIHETHTGRKYGEFDPQFGCVVESYSHKKRLLRERGWVELPPEDPEAVAAEQDPKRIERDPNVIAGDSVDEVLDQVNRSQINRELTGDLEKRTRQWKDEAKHGPDTPWALK